MRILASIFVVLLCIAAEAKADKLCLKTTVNKRTFKVTTQSMVASTCPTGYTAVADTSSFRGPAGIVPLGSCRTQANTCTHSPNVFNSCAATCSSGEFLLSYDVSNTSNCNPESYPVYFHANYSNGVPYGVTYYSGTIGGSCNVYTATVRARCCPTT